MAFQIVKVNAYSLWYSMYKMLASFCIIHLIGTFCILRVSALPSITALFYENPINEGLEAMLHCAVLRPPNEYVIDIIKDSTFLVRHDEVQPQTGMDMSLSSDGNTLILKIANIHRDNSGMYTCKLLVPEPGVAGAWRTVSSDRTDLTVHYFSEPPRCLLNNMNGVVLEHEDRIGATCTATQGNPAVNIQWTKILANGVKIPQTSSYAMTSSTTIAELESVFYKNEDNVIYTCTVSSPAFPNVKDNTCTIGPFNLKPTPPPPPPPIPEEDTTFEIPTSDGPEVRVGANPEMGTPAIVGIVVVLLIVSLSAFLFLLMRFRKVTSEKHLPQDVEGLSARDTAIPPCKSNPSIKHGKDLRKSKNKSFTVIAEVLPMRKGKFYPPPPAYPTPDQQKELNAKYLTQSNDSNKMDEVMSVSSWGDILDSGQSSNSGDQFANDGDGLVEPKRETKADSLKRMFGASTGHSTNIYSNEIIMYSDVKKPLSARGRGSLISQSSFNSKSPLYATIQ